MPPELTPALLNELFRFTTKPTPPVSTHSWRANSRSADCRTICTSSEETFAIVLGAPYVFLDTYPDGAVSSDALWAEHDAEIRRHSPWLDEQNFN